MSTASSSDSASLDKPGLVGQQLGDFLLVECKAKGGFGLVYYALQKPFDRPVAVKVLMPQTDMSPNVLKRVYEAFLREGRIMSELDLPNLVPAIAAGMVKLPTTGVEVPWLALRWVPGVDLDTWIKARRAAHRAQWEKTRGPHAYDVPPNPLPPGEALALLRPIMRTLGRVHRRQPPIAHRDIKPGNILLVEENGTRTPFLVDFGIAKEMAENEDVGSGNTATKSAMRNYSPRYAAPEQVAGIRSGPWTDVHALALILSELLADVPPYFAPSNEAAKMKVFSPQRPTPGRLGVVVDGWEPIFERALALETTARYQDALTFLEALENARPDLREGGAAGTASSAAEVKEEPTLRDPPRVVSTPATSTVSRPPAKPADRASVPNAARSSSLEERTSERVVSNVAPHAANVDDDVMDDAGTRFLPPAPTHAGVAKPADSSPRAASPALAPRPARHVLVGVSVAALVGLGLAAFLALRSAATPQAPAAAPITAPTASPPPPPTASTAIPSAQAPAPSAPVRVATVADAGPTEQHLSAPGPTVVPAATGADRPPPRRRPRAAGGEVIPE